MSSNAHDLRYKKNKTRLKKEVKLFCKNMELPYTNEIANNIWEQLQIDKNPMFFNFEIAYKKAAK